MTGSDGLTDEQRAQIAERDHLVREGLSAASRIRLNRDLLMAPPAVRDHAVVKAVVGYLVGAGYTTTPAPQAGLRYIEIPDHLQPDIEAMIEGNRLVAEAILGHPDNLSGRDT